MPELPEIETLCRDLRREIVGKTISDFVCRQPKSLNMSVEEMKEKVIGQRVSDVVRRAKSAVISLGNGDLWVHLGLGGHLISDFRFDSEKGTTGFAFDDKKALHIEKAFMGHTHFLGAQESKARWDEFGVDPFDTAMGIGTFSDMTAEAGSTPIKVLLQDQSKIAGIGSTYADEILHRTGIHPAKKSGDIASREAGILLDNLKRIMVQAILDRGAQGEWLNLNETPGHYKLLVHGKEICGSCGGEVEKTTISGTTTYLCPKEQLES